MIKDLARENILDKLLEGSMVELAEDDMRFDGGRLHPQFDLGGANPRGPTQVVRAALDPVRIPTEPVIVDLLKNNLCIARVENGGYAIRNPLGDLRMLRYGASVADWKTACEELMALAMEPSRVV